jgi:C_GCAxxG_C_C family probable redox protein
MQEIDIAVDYFESGYSCAQAILTAFGEMFGLDNGIAIKIAGAFGAGMSYSGQTCGAVSGALMVIGLKYGATGEDKQLTYEIARDFIRRFTARNGTISCTELLGYDLGIPEQLEAARGKGLFSTRCNKFVQDSAAILMEML